MTSTPSTEARPEIVGAGTPPSSSQRNWFECHQFLTALIEQSALGPLPVAGTPSWMQLANGEPRKLLALAEAGVHHVLRIDTEQEQRAEASRAIASATDCTALARRVRNGRGPAYIKREVS